MVNLITEHIDIWTSAQTQKANAGRGRGKNSNGQSQHGIKKLRELILELAVRGKLVPPACRQAGKTPMTLPTPEEGAWWVYVIECEDGSFYKGFTGNLPRRWNQHIAGTASDWTKNHPPKQVFYWEKCYSKEAAIRREDYLKSGSGREWFEREVVENEKAWQPASTLLEKIAKEKARLIKKGKIKRQKPLPEISEDEKPFELPEGWEWVRLGETGIGSTGKTPSTKTPKYYNGTTPFLGPGQITLEGEITESDKTLTEEGCEYSVIADSGDILMVCIGGSIGKSAIARSKVAFNQQINCIRPLFVDSTYLNFATNTPLFQTSILDAATGSATPIINRSKWEELLVALAPLSEQHRIIAKVDELMTLCDQLEQQQTDSNATHQTLVETLLATLTYDADQGEFAEAWQRIANHFDTLFTTEQSLDHLKQTILQLAVMGKLVPHEPMELPEAHPGRFFVYALEREDKSIYIGQTDDILERWKEHATGKGAEWTRKHPPLRLVHWEEYDSHEEARKREKDLNTDFGRKWIKRELAGGRTRQAGEPAIVLLEKIAKEKARLIKEGKIKKQKPLPEVGEDEKPFELPEGWEWVRFPEVGEFGRGKSKHRPRNDPSLYSDGKYPMVQTGDVARANGVVKTYTALYNAKGLSQSRLWPKGTMCITIAANIADSGILGLDACFPDSVVGLIPFAEIGDARYFEYFMRTAKKQLMDFAPSTAQKNINLGILETIYIPLPPSDEIKRIVTKVDELMALCDTLKVRFNDAQTTQVQLADAIVEQAVA